VPLASPRRVIDIGCGPGNSTALLIARYPEAEVVGLDSSPDMLRRARERVPTADFVLADVAAWNPSAGTDLLFGNAVFQWVPDHAAVLARLLGTLPPGGVLAVQMPDNTDEPALALMHAVAAREPWAEALAPVRTVRPALLRAGDYYDLLRPQAKHLDIWRTIYHHRLPGPEAVVAWFAGSSLRPFLAALAAPLRDDFIAAYAAQIARAYPTQFDGTVLLPFPRLFIVAAR
jgi:trans-aconitate 2-methyltransferase